MAIKRSIALGFFDGVHVGHAALLNCALKRAEEHDLLPSVLSFDVHPDLLVTGKDIRLINSAADREGILKRQFGIQDMVFLHFSKSLMTMPWHDFLDSFVDEMQIGWIVAGHDFTFGYKGEGNPERLKEYCREKGIGCDIISPVRLDDVIVSSTYIRGLLSEGKIEEANRYLGHPHVLTDEIRSGYHLGTQIGTPTINMFFQPGVLIPRHGVYAAKAYIDGKVYKAVTNIGVRPTVSSDDRVSVESYLLDFTGNLYGHSARIEFYYFLRGEMKFDSVDELSARIKADAETADRLLSQLP